MTASVQTPTRRAESGPSAFNTFMSRHSSLMPTFAALAILILLFVGAQIYFGNFLTPRVISSLLLDNAYLLVLAVGMTFVILTGGIDLSVGAVVALSTVLCAYLIQTQGISTLADHHDSVALHQPVVIARQDLGDRGFSALVAGLFTRLAPAL